jgi:RNA polymerase sigma factor (sigma-70 family)
MSNKESEAGLEERVKSMALVKAREKLGITQEEAAEKIGISKASLCNYENMNRYPSPAMQNRICGFYRQSGQALYENEAFPEYMRAIASEKNYRGESIPDELLVSLNSIKGYYLPHDILNDSTDKQIIVEELLKGIPKRYEEILTMRYGLGGKEPKTLIEVGKECSMTRERVRKLEEKAISLLRKKAGDYRRKEMI